jgi:hypothetical protein
MHREEREFSILLHVSAEFDAEYEGDDDGYAWFERFETLVRPRVVAAVFEAIRDDPAWSATPGPRGRDPERTVEIDVRFRNPRSPAAASSS